MKFKNSIPRTRRAIITVIGSFVGLSKVTKVSSRNKEKSNGGTIKYEELPPDAQEIFKNTLKKQNSKRTLYALPNVFQKYDKVVYSGDKYLLNFSSELIPSYQIAPLKTEGDKSSSIKFNNLTQLEKEAFTSALSNGTYSKIGNNSEHFGYNTIIQKDNELYSLNLVWGAADMVEISSRKIN